MFNLIKVKVCVIDLVEFGDIECTFIGKYTSINTIEDLLIKRGYTYDENNNYFYKELEDADEDTMVYFKIVPDKEIPTDTTFDPE
jgi:hypothetical protein